MVDPKEKSLHKHVRIAPEQWERLEQAAQGTPHSPNQILVELAMEALDRREWPSTEVEMRVARASLFTAQAIALDLIAAGREKEVQEIRDFISTLVPDPDTGSHSPAGVRRARREALYARVQRTREFGGIRVRMVEYTPGYLADYWCEKGHVLLCLEGELLTELADGRTFTLIPGTSYQVADGAEPHRSSTSVGAKLFVVD